MKSLQLLKPADIGGIGLDGGFLGIKITHSLVGFLL